MNFLNRIAEFAERRVEEYGARYTAFGVYSLICFVLPIYMWTRNTAGHLSVLTFRVFAIILSFFLAISSAWYPAFRRYLPLYWYLVVTFCLPFFSTYLVIIDGLSLFWIVNIAIALILGMALLDFGSFVIIFPLGAVSAFIFAHLLGHDLHNISIPNEFLYPSCYLLFFVFVIAAVFFKNKEQTHVEKIKAMKNLAASIAHELRTPLGTIIMQLNLLDKKSNEDGKDTKSLKERKAIMLGEANYINYIINMTLARLKEHKDEIPLTETMPISEYIDYAVNRYPFGRGEKELINIRILDDFLLTADKNLMSQVLFNLIQNALHQIKSVNKGEIFITTTSNRKRKILHVKDTSTGIKQAQIDNIFKPFFTKKSTGTGIGLYYCQSTIRAMNGSIRCESVYGEYTDFIIEF